MACSAPPWQTPAAGCARCASRSEEASDEASGSMTGGSGRASLDASEPRLEAAPPGMDEAALNAAAAATASQLVVATASQLMPPIVADMCGPCAVKSVKIPEKLRAQKHLERMESSFLGFKCKCASARSKGQDSCLESFTKGQLRTVHRETYGSSTSVGNVLQHIHTLYCTQAVLLENGPDAIGRRYKMPSLNLLGIPVCAVAFREAVGGARAAHKLCLGYALRIEDRDHHHPQHRR